MAALKVAAIGRAVQLLTQLPVFQYRLLETVDHGVELARSLWWKADAAGYIGRRCMATACLSQVRFEPTATSQALV